MGRVHESLLTFGFVAIGLSAAILDELHDHAADGGEEERMDKAAFMQKKLFDYPEGEKDQSYVPEHLLVDRCVI